TMNTKILALAVIAVLATASVTSAVPFRGPGTPPGDPKYCSVPNPEDPESKIARSAC
ncbi:hypothetical protein BGW38_004035, partial [Lunasporangiospora selenospora]